MKECIEEKFRVLGEVLTQALEGLRVLDFTTGMAGPLATMIFADYGAEVIRVEPAGGDPLWSHPAYLLWQRGKKSVQFDITCKQGKEQVQALIASSDALFESMKPGVADECGIGYKVARSLNDKLVYCSISAFGQTGPYRHLKACDGIVNAKTGRMRDQVGHQKDRPTYRAINDASYHTAMFSVQAVLSALRIVSLTGHGQYIDCSLLRGTTAPYNPWLRIEGQELPPDRFPNQADLSAVLKGEFVLDRREADPYTAIPSQLCTLCKDNRWIMHAHPAPHLFRAWIHTIGLDWIWQDSRYSGAPLSFSDDADRVALNLRILQRMKEKTSQQWIELYRENPDCSGEVMNSTQEALLHPQFIASHHLIELDDPRVGRIAQVGPLVAMSDTPAEINDPAPVPGQHSNEILTLAVSVRRSGPSGRRSSRTWPRHPLEGITIIEIASWLATPFAGALLADLGARVIKVEPLTGDPMRAAFTNEHNRVRANQGKESIAVNLKSAEGREILHRLVTRADAIIQNFRPGVPQRLGMDYATLSAVNDGLVYLCASSYGSEGPDSGRAAFNPTIGAFSGNSVFQSGQGNVPIGDQAADPIAGSAVATSVLLGLAARERTGKGQYLETTMINSCVYCNSDDALNFEGKPPRRCPDYAQLGLEATYRLYESKDGWVFLAATEDDEFERFCSTVGLSELLGDRRYATATARYQHRRELAEVLSSVFRRTSSEDWEVILSAVDVGCVRADGMGYRRFLHEDVHATEINFMVPTRASLFADRSPEGRYWRHSPIAIFSATPCKEGQPYVGLGEQTVKILDELGYSGDDAACLKDAGIVDYPI